MALGSAVLARPTESVEIRGVKAVSDDVLCRALVPAVPTRPVRAGFGKGIGQRDRGCSLATSVRVAVERHEEAGGLCGELSADGISDAIARETEKQIAFQMKFLANLEMLRGVVVELEGLSASEKRRRVVALRPVLEACGGCPAHTPASVAIWAEIQAALL